MTDYTIRTTCRLCEGPLELVLDLGETPLANELMETAEGALDQDRFPLRLCQCQSCGHMMIDCVVNPERLFRKYPYRSGLTESYREHLAEYGKKIFEEVKSRHPYDANSMVATNARWSTPPVVVEVGGNDGCLSLTLVKIYRMKYINVDPCDSGQPLGERIPEFFTSELAKQIRAEHGPAQAVVANHVFAHADNLADIADGIRELLADDGTAWIEVGHGPTQLNSGCLDVIYHEHVSYHDEASLVQFLETRGLFVRQIWHNGAQGGSMRIACSKRPIAGRLTVNSPPGDFDIASIKVAAEHLKGLGELLYKVDRNIRYPVGLYGCPAKATTLMRLMEFVPQLAFDDAPQKVGRFLPGTQTAIRSPAELEWCDSALIASWNFADQIIAAHPEYTGTWIVPLPQVRLVKGGGG